MPPLPLREDQIDDLAKLIQHKKFMFLSDPGTGKTPPVCVFFEYLKGLGKGAIWTMPKSLLKKNKAEIHAFTNLKDDEVVIIDGNPKERTQQLMQNAVVYLCGFKRFADDWKSIKNLHPEVDCVAVDEYHMGFKTHNSQQTKQLFLAFDRPIIGGGGMEYFVPMSGTIIAGRLDSCYSAIKIIEPRYYANHWDFMNQHAFMDEYGRAFSWKNHDKLGRIFMNHGVRRTFESIYGNQDPIIIPELADMHPDQRKMYDEFEEKGLIELENSLLYSQSEGVHALRCRQIMAHPHTFGILKPDQRTGKDDLLEIHLEDHMNLKDRFVIFSSLVPEQERIFEMCKKMGFRMGLINGKVKDKGAVDVAFQNKEIDGIVGSLATATVGFNWGFVDHLMIASMDYADDTFKQGIRRAIRNIREKQLRVSNLEYRKSMDQRIYQVVNWKSEQAEKVDASYRKLSLGAPKDC